MLFAAFVLSLFVPHLLLLLREGCACFVISALPAPSLIFCTLHYCT